MTRKQFLTTVYSLGLVALVSAPVMAQQKTPEPAATPAPAAPAATPAPATPAAKPAATAHSHPAGESKAATEYDVKSEVTISGTIEHVKTPTGKNAAHERESVMLKTASGSVDVHLAPADYWTKNGFKLTRGASIEVTGAKMSSGKTEVILARTVKEGEKTVTLRKADGTPEWAHHQHAK